MGITNDLLENKDFVSSSLKSLIAQECKRILDAGLMSKSDCFSFIEKSGCDQTKNGIPGLLSIYDSLSKIKLAGDKLDCSLPVKKEVVVSNGVGEPKVDQDFIKLQQLDSLITDKLEKIAYFLGRAGDHESAYLIERTLNGIKSQIKNGSIGEDDNSNELAERNKVLISEAEQLLSEFDIKFPNATYLHFVKAIRTEMRKSKETDPVKVANTLRNVWNSK